MDRIESELRESRSDARRMETELHGVRRDVQRILELLSRGESPSNRRTSTTPAAIEETTTVAKLVKNPGDEKVEKALNSALLRVRSIRKSSALPSVEFAEDYAPPPLAQADWKTLRDKHREQRRDLGV